ncbi:MAG: hypothetical protein JXL97_11380 [Bacteroidales bacterium]|nr:hypothetical protein [Bacteroidales bacterium]
MNDKYTFLLVALFLFSGIINAQNSDIQFIRDSYNSAQENINYQLNEEIPQDNMKITVNQNIAAIGPQTIEYTYYFDYVFLDEPTYEYTHKLYFATRSYNVAASLFSYEEFLYNENGELIFYFLRENSAYSELDFEIRLYYKQNQLIKVIAKELKEAGDPENSDDYVKTFEAKNDVPEYFEDRINTIINLGKSIKDIYLKVDGSF